MVGLLLLGGCGAAAESVAHYSLDEQATVDVAWETTAEPDLDLPEEGRTTPADTTDVKDDSARSGGRQMIYTADIQLVVADFSSLRGQIDKLIAAHDGVLADSSVDLRYGDRPSGSWTVRVPAEQLDAFQKGVQLLGTAEQSTRHGQDVTEEYVDIQARLTNRRRLEQRLLDLMENKQGDLKHVLQVETELARVREGIEQIEGRFRYLKDRIRLSTVTIRARQERDYTPPNVPTFAVEIQETFAESLEQLLKVSKGLVLAGVFMVPWLPVPLVVMGLPWWIWRRRHLSSLRDGDQRIDRVEEVK